jgi:anti-anti-sigma regulatory factor
MATKDDRPNLLSKMALFVRNPNVDWSELGKVEPEQEAGYDKQALKAMIERRRQNDFVRKREFDNLRKLRSKDPVAMASAARPSFFQSSLPADSEGRADTLKKIDEIEAQMSKQWWKGKQEATAQAAGGVGASVNKIDATKTGMPVIAPAPADERFAPTEVAGLQARTSPPVVEFAPTEMGAGMPPLPSRDPSRRTSAGGLNTGLSSFSGTDLLAMESGGILTDTDLEEAAIRFANGDDEGAQGVLVNALAGNALDTDVAHVWAAALLDFYRATGQASAFEKAAQTYASRLGNLRPRWVDLRSVKTSGAGSGVLSSQIAPLSEKVHWKCQEVLTEVDMESLRATLSQSAPPWRLDWSDVDEISDKALPFLAGFFSSLCAEPVQLQFVGGNRIAKVLRDMTPSGRPVADDIVWTIRLDALRAMRRQEEFELAALDFCITFEVPPPEWRPAVCDYVDGDVELANLAQGRGDATTMTMPLGLHGSKGTTLELAGQVTGENIAALSQLTTDHAAGAHLVVSCKGLLRIDFSAAGNILNWAAACHSQGCQIQFRDVHRLVAAFYNVIGITEYAKVMPLDIA